MDFFEVVDNRQSIRKYEDREFGRQEMRQILDTINSAPSAGNLQGYEVVIVSDPAARAELAKAAYDQPAITQAPVSLVFCADHARSASKYGKRGADLYAVQDATIAAAYCQLAAAALELATVWIGAFDTRLVAEAVKAPGDVTPVAIIPIGYAAEHPEHRPRRDIFDLIRENRF
jgi:nitroreductase